MLVPWDGTWDGHGWLGAFSLWPPNWETVCGWCHFFSAESLLDGLCVVSCGHHLSFLALHCFCSLLWLLRKHHFLCLGASVWGEIKESTLCPIPDCLQVLVLSKQCLVPVKGLSISAKDRGERRKFKCSTNPFLSILHGCPFSSTNRLFKKLYLFIYLWQSFGFFGNA